MGWCEHAETHGHPDGPGSSRPKIGEQSGVNEERFLNNDGRRRMIGEEEASRYRNVANDNESID